MCYLKELLQYDDITVFFFFFSRLEEWRSSSNISVPAKLEKVYLGFRQH